MKYISLLMVEPMIVFGVLHSSIRFLSTPESSLRSTNAPTNLGVFPPLAILNVLGWKGMCCWKGGKMKPAFCVLALRPGAIIYYQRWKGEEKCRFHLLPRRADNTGVSAPQIKDFVILVIYCMVLPPYVSYVRCHRSRAAVVILLPLHCALSMPDTLAYVIPRNLCLKQNRISNHNFINYFTKCLVLCRSCTIFRYQFLFPFTSDTWKTSCWCLPTSWWFRIKAISRVLLVLPFSLTIISPLLYSFWLAWLFIEGTSSTEC